VKVFVEMLQAMYKRDNCYILCHVFTSPEWTLHCIVIGFGQQLNDYLSCYIPNNNSQRILHIYITS